MKADEMELILRSFDDRLEASDQLRLEDLLAGSAEARAAEAEFRRLRSLTADKSGRAFDPGFADRVMAATAPSSSPQSHPSNASHFHASRRPSPRASMRVGRTTRRGAFMSAAATVLAAVAIIYLLAPRSTTVPHGAMRTVSLADGSTVELSGGSTMRYGPFWLRDHRRIRLDGEAYFNVARHDKPFVVETFNAGVTVLGTRFNVRAWEADPLPETTVAVASGRVAVEAKAADATLKYAPLVLHPGQATVVVADSSAAHPARPASFERVTTWRSGGLAFTDQPLSSVFKTIERRFGVDVHSNDLALQQLVVTYLNPNPRSAEEVLSDICHTLDLRYRRTATGYEILPN